MKKSTQVAIGGLAAALCLLMMFMTGLIPFSSYALPSFAGIVLIAVAEENGNKTALLVYLVVAVMSLFIVPDPEAKLLFIMFFGYYPVLKPFLDRIPKVFQWILKLGLFNGVVILFYYVSLYVLGLPDLLDGWGEFGRYTTYIALGMGNFTFVMYDYLLSQVLQIYRNWFRPKILRKIT